MAKQNFSERYDQLEADVELALKKAIEESKVESKHINENCIPVNIFGYKELVIINDRLTFLDKEGYHNSLYADCTIIDLIDIINQLD
jgi:hypothetical protein